ncbi:uncharacterized protein RJT21DRAFT_114681 [Scheffersomyces amazonensis]|uniref:uncharacterized protein n=1 Tax=Scheffersomyces amazonensis TaxID=1078765 RepID=UPI00315DF322
MCGRFALGVNLNELPSQFNNTVFSHEQHEELTESSPGIYEGSIRGSEDDMRRVQFDFTRVNQWDGSYNIAPTNTAIVIYMVNTISNNNLDYKYVVESSKFGLVPFWAKPQDPAATERDGKKGNEYSKELQRTQARYFNCRKESLSSGQAVWNSCKKRTRCVVPIQGYFEWLKPKGSKLKIPNYVHSTKSPIIYLAGMYSHNTNYKSNYNVNDEYLSSFTILTGPATREDLGDISWLHDRKPILLEPDTKAWYDWLNPDQELSEKVLEEILNTKTNKAYVDIEGYEVSKDVGNPSNKSKGLIEKVKKNKPITSFFSANKKRIKTDDDEDDDDSHQHKKIKKEDANEYAKATEHKDSKVKREVEQ